MKKMLNTSFVYAIAAMIAGVFFREFTKFNGFTGRTSLSFMHLHLFVLGALLFLILELFRMQINLVKQKHFKTFFILYNIGLPLMVVMFFVRGVTQVLETPLTKSMDAMISGVAGVGHILTGVGLIILFTCLKKTEKI
ncbi:DUF2871 domain-containing protein [Hydrogenoanaerobacterium sp.]|uniref:DUF2871 domain-containing protein n=1 Tax=Hydrogenoanaerobacterium sp. TaxID=2953763 RepID=UPI00289FA272|nr:DUF2871 domain-containing protein [Hydrogenoanaerobacterium sp.]